MMYKIIIIMICISLVDSSLAPTHLLVTRAGPCPGKVKDVITVTELSLATHTYDSLISGELNISEDISNGWKIKATMQKCVDIRNIDTCDFFRSFYLVHNGCSDDEDDDEQELYGMLFHYANPKLECPVKKGRYKIMNYPLFTEDNYFAVHEAKISTSIFGYIFRLDGFTAQRRKIFCAEAHLQLLYMRDHDWIENTDLEITTLGPPVSEEEIEEDGEERSRSIMSPHFL